MKIKRNLLSGLYVIIDSAYVPEEKFEQAVLAIKSSDVKIVQFRDKISSPQDVLRYALRIQRILPRDIIYIINDYVEIAVDIGADGVHLGQNDMKVTKARSVVGEDMIIGLSTHSVEEALRALSEPVDYIGYGPVYATKTKPGLKPIHPNGITKFRKLLHMPVFAIGGIDKSNIDTVLETGADGASIVSAIWESKDWPATMQMYAEQIKQYHLLHTAETQQL
ncbi:MAG: thiamine phosphate synthase [Chlamydiota bacterium]|nr:thiamine phosphate synthase [Chlamydiota bacterium]